jgi:hypothetical protein
MVTTAAKEKEEEQRYEYIENTSSTLDRYFLLYDNNKSSSK